MRTPGLSRRVLRRRKRQAGRIGCSSGRRRRSPTPVAEGSSATATAVVLDGAAGDCANGGQDVNPIAVNRFRIYPPNQTVPLYVSVVSTGTLPLPICADSPPNTLSIYALGVQPSSEN